MCGSFCKPLHDACIALAALIVKSGDDPPGVAVAAAALDGEVGNQALRDELVRLRRADARMVEQVGATVRGYSCVLANGGLRVQDGGSLHLADARVLKTVIGAAAAAGPALHTVFALDASLEAGASLKKEELVDLLKLLGEKVPAKVPVNVELIDNLKARAASDMEFCRVNHLLTLV